MSPSSQEVLHFWFQELQPADWFKKDPSLDAQIRSRFFPTFQILITGQASAWQETPSARLAEIIVLDQMTRNMFRGTAEAFSGDRLALRRAMEAVAAKDDQKLPIEQRQFIYMPYMHSEDLQVHEIAVQLFNQKGMEERLKYEILHKEIIERFGRYPHRNAILGRASTSEEIEFLKTAGSSF